MNVARPKSLADIRVSACQMFADVAGDPKRAPQVHEAVNALGKAVNATKTYLEFCALSGKKPSGDWAKFIGGENPRRNQEGEGK